MDPSPSWEVPLLPQQYNIPDVVTPHVWFNPADSDLNVYPPTTATGTAEPAVAPEVLFPNCPYVLSPQQYAWPVFERAHACDIPLVTCTYPRVPPTVGELVTVAVRDAVAVNATVGVNVGPVVALTVADGVTYPYEVAGLTRPIGQMDWPVWLLSFAPQHDAAPDAVSPHV